MLIKDLNGNIISNNSDFINRDDREKWINNGIKFNGNQVISSNLSGVNNWNTATPFSVNIIFKPTKVGAYEVIFTNWINDIEGSNAFSIDLRLNGTFWVSFQLTGIEGEPVTVPYTINETIVIGVTYNGYIMKVYKNGVFFDSVSTNRIVGDSNTVYIGSTGNRGIYSSTAIVYDVKVFKKTLSETEVFELFNTRGKIVPTTATNDVLLDLGFDEKTGTIANDKSKNSYNGSLIGFTETSLGSNNCHVDYTGQPISG
jgi:Concanavalin A-like lectin/glucanases superfamily